MKELPGTGVYFPDNDAHFTNLKGGAAAKIMSYQADRIEEALKYVRRRRVAVDAGAHVGLITRKLAALFDQVIAFEPNPTNFACLQVNTQGLANVTIHNAALGDKSGVIWTASSGDGNSGNVQVQGDSHKGAPMSAPLRTLDSLKLEELDLLKIDVQGYEYYVLAGAAQTIRYCRPVCIVEVERDGLRLEYEYTSKQGVGLLKQSGAVKMAEISADQIWAFPYGDNIPFDKYDNAGDYHWEKYEKSLGMINMIHAVAQTVKDGGHDSVLDIGCGDGLYTALIGPNAYGIDTSAVGIECARKHGVACEQRSLFDIEAMGRRWDAVCLFDTFEHLFEQKLAIATIGKVTNRLYLLNPEPSPDTRADGYHTREFEAGALVEWMAARGWRCIKRQDFKKTERNQKSLLVFDKE